MTEIICEQKQWLNRHQEANKDGIEYKSESLLEYQMLRRGGYGHCIWGAEKFTRPAPSAETYKVYALDQAEKYVLG